MCHVVGENKSSCKINNSSWQTCSSGNGLCPSPLPSIPGYILPSSKQSSSALEERNSLFASLPSASKVEPGTNCLSPAPLPSVPGYISPGLPEFVNPNPLFSSVPCASRVKPGTNCLSPAPLPSVPGYVSPVPCSVVFPHTNTATITSTATKSIPHSQEGCKQKYDYAECSNLENNGRQKVVDECYATPCSVRQLKPTAQTQSPCMWAGSSREVPHSELSAVQSLSSTLETQLMIKAIKETGRWSPVPPTDPALGRQFPTNLSFTNYETQEPSNYTPPLIQKPVLPTFLCKPTPPPPVISFPPDFDPTPIVHEFSRSRSSTPIPTKANEITSKISESTLQKSENSLCDEAKTKQKSDLEVSSSERKAEEKPLAAEPACQRKYVAEVRTLANNVPQTKFDTSFLSKNEEKPPGVLPVAMSIEKTDELYSTAAVSLPAETSPYYPDSMREKPEPKVFRPEPPQSGSPLLCALTTASGRCYSPLPSVTKPPTPPPVDSLPDFETELPVIPGVRPVSMLAALTVASERPYSPIPQYPPVHSVSAPKADSKEDEKKENYILTLEKNVWSPKGLEITLTEEIPESYGSDNYVSQKSELKGKQCVKIPCLSSAHRLSFTNSGLHKPSTIPSYQQNIGDGTYTPRARSPQPPQAATESSVQNQPAQSNVASDSTNTPKTETKALKSCVKLSKVPSTGSEVTSTITCESVVSSRNSVCSKTGQVCKKVTISETAAATPSITCQRSVCEPSLCERSVCAKSCDDPKQNLSKTCPYFVPQPESSEEPKTPSNIATKSCCKIKSTSQSDTKQVCTVSTSQTCAKKVSIVESRSSTVTSASSVSSSSQEKNLSTLTIQSPTVAKSTESCLRSTKADLGTTTSSSTCTRPCVQQQDCNPQSTESARTGQDSTTSSSCGSCPLNKSSEETPQPRPVPITSTKLALSTSHRLSPLAVSDIPLDATQAFCKTASGSQIFKPPISAKPAETKPTPPTTTNQKTVSQSTATTLDTKSSSTCKLTSESKLIKPSVPSVTIQPVPQSSKSIPLTEAAAFTASPTITATPPSTPTTVSQSPNSAFSLARKTNGSVASSLSKTLSAKIAANKNISSSPASIPNTGSASTPNPGAGGTTKGGTAAGLTAPRRGRGVLNPQNLTPGARVPLCGQCNEHIRGPFITALGKIWCPDHFICVNKDCRRPLQDIGFVEESSGLYCEYCFEKYLAPTCHKCSSKIKGDCLNAIGKHFHPECFKCAFCNKMFGNNPFFLEEGLPYCENDWNELFTTKCFACGFPIEAGDRWVEALNNNYHSPCFNCTQCKKNLEGESFFAKGGRPFCKSHAR